MSLADINPDHALLVVPGTGYYKRTSDGLFVTECQGRAGVREALMGSDGSTTTEFPSIRYPRGFTFDGGDTIHVGDDDDLSFGNGTIDFPFTLAALIRSTALGVDKIIAKSITTSSGEYQLFIDADGRLRMLCIDNSASASIGRMSATGEIREGIYYVVVGTYSGSGAASGVKLYKDAEQVDNAGDSGETGSYTAMENTATPVRISTNFTGDIILPMIFDKELTAEEVRVLTARYRAMYAIGPRR